MPEIGRARLVVLGVEICGRWSVETQPFELIGTRTGVFFEAFVEEPFWLEMFFQTTSCSCMEVQVSRSFAQPFWLKLGVTQ